MIGGNIKLAIIGALALAGISFAARYVWLERTVAHDGAVEQVQAEEREAADAASSARARVRNCYASGGVWDRQAGKCDRPVPVNR